MCDVGSCAEECEEQSASAALSDSALERLDHLLRGALTASALVTHSVTTNSKVITTSSRRRHFECPAFASASALPEYSQLFSLSSTTCHGSCLMQCRSETRGGAGVRRGARRGERIVATANGRLASGRARARPVAASRRPRPAFQSSGLWRLQRAIAPTDSGGRAFANRWRCGRLATRPAPPATAVRLNTLA